MGRVGGERRIIIVVSILGMVLLSGGCTNYFKLKELDRNCPAVEVAMANDAAPASVRDSLLESAPDDRIAVVDLQGEVLIMDAVKDEQSGEMVISQRLQAVVVEAKFRNVAERNGYVDIAFDVKVPREMMHSTWQLRLEPSLRYLNDTLPLERIFITGSKYRKGQLRGYELYNKFLDSIIPDTCSFIGAYTNRHLLEIFIQRHFEEVALLKSDTSFIDNSVAENLFGVTLKEAVEHYTKHFLVKRNNRRKGRTEKMFAKYVKVPLEKEGIRLDSIIAGDNDMLVYRYVQSIKTCRDLRKIDMVMDGGIYKENRMIYRIPQVGPLTYYISSMTFFADNSTRFLKKIISRNAVANTAAYIDFKVGDATLCDTLHENSGELARIRKNIATLLSDTSYVVDSLVVTASCSPEGDYAYNEKLAQKRAVSIKKYFSDYIRKYTDSLSSEYWNMELEGSGSGEDLSGNGDKRRINDIVKMRHVAENWEQLERILRSDTTLAGRESFESILRIPDADKRERALAGTSGYPYIRSVVYPLLRTVRFGFYLHRKGMIKDTIHTTVVDTAYMKGVEALVERDYESAVTILRPYNDINSAVAYICMDYNNSALQVLESLPESARRNYMLAVVWARLGDEKRAVEHFLHSVEQDAAMRHRGNLDPEISALIRKYNLNRVSDDDINQF